MCAEQRDLQSHAIKVMTADTKSAVAVNAAPLVPGTAVIMIRRARAALPLMLIITGKNRPQRTNYELDTAGSAAMLWVKRIN